MTPLKTTLLCLIPLLALLAYLLFWPIPINPVAWQAPQGQGFVDDFKANTLLSNIQLSNTEFIDISPHQGAEDFALDSNKALYTGILYTGTSDGSILRISTDGKVENWHNTGGRPLGMEFDQQGDLIVADAHLGLLRIDPQGKQSVLTDSYEGKPFGFTDDLDISSDGRIFFSDASSKFAANASDELLQASLLDIMEHGGHGRVFVYNPADQSTQLLTAGMNFANGIAVSFDQQSILVNETGHYRVLKIGIGKSNFGKSEVLIDNLPGFPDNLNKGQNGRYWLGLTAPRNALLDNMSDHPWLRKIVQRLPAFLHPKPIRYGHVVAINDVGEVLQSLQDPTGQYANTTGATEVGGKLYISNLGETTVARLTIKTK